MTLVNDQIQAHWTNIAPLLTVRNEREYNAAVKRMNELLDEIGTNEKHPLTAYSTHLGHSSTPTKKSTFRFLNPAVQKYYVSSWTKTE